MRLFDILPVMKPFTQLKRPHWFGYVIRGTESGNWPLVMIDYPSSQKLTPFTPTYDDLIADDWELVE